MGLLSYVDDSILIGDQGRNTMGTAGADTIIYVTLMLGQKNNRQDWLTFYTHKMF